MKLFKRDYSQLYASEKSKWRALQRKEGIGKPGLRFAPSQFRKYPKAARHFVQLFPNNYLDIVELKQMRRLEKQIANFRRLLDSPGVTEREILRFINGRRAYFIIGALLKDHFHFGHHEAFLFREFPLGTSYKADYLLVGKSSGGWSFVFVELESPSGSATTKDGRLGKCFRQGTNQIDDWKKWLYANYSSLKEVFDKCRRPEENFPSDRCANGALPREFMELDPTRLNFVVVAGRRRHFKNKTYLERRKKQQEGATLLLHYDNILDCAEAIMGAQTY
jgi:hypothetical protein